MRDLCIILLSAIVCAGSRSGASEAPAPAGSSFHPFPVIPPVADADPSIRHPVTARVPALMQVVRHGNSLTVAFPGLQTTNLMVGHKMATGIMREESIDHGGKAYPLGISLQGGLDLEASTNTLTLRLERLPQPGQEFTFEYRVTLFETDLPAQHEWSPQSGKLYRVLWTRTFKQTIR